MNMMQQTYASDDRRRMELNEAKEIIAKAKKDARMFLLNGIEHVQDAIHDLRLSMKAADPGKRMEYKWGDVWGWPEVGAVNRDVTYVADEVARMLEYMLEILRNVYDQKDNIQFEALVELLKYAIDDWTD